MVIKSIKIWVLVFLTAAYLAMFAWLHWGRHFNLIVSDAAGYWHSSLQLSTPFHPFHVPGYPVLIAVVNWLTGNLLSPLFVMELITFSAYLIAVGLVMRWLEQQILDTLLVAMGGLLFGLFPFVGLVYAVYPIADLVGLTWFMGGLAAIQSGRRLWGGLFLGLAAFTHKSLWPFVAIFMVFQAWQTPGFFREKWKVTAQGLLMVLPVGGLWLLGAQYYGEWNWIMASNLSVEFASHSYLPILDGVIGTILSGSVTEMLKGVILISLMAAALFLFFVNWRLSSPAAWQVGMPIALTVLLYCLILNQYEIWAAIRFGRLLTIPFVLWLASSASMVKALNSSMGRRMVYGVTLILLSLTFLYAWYMVAVFFA